MCSLVGILARVPLVQPINAQHADFAQDWYVAFFAKGLERIIRQRDSPPVQRIVHQEAKREGWVLLKIPRGDMDGVGEVGMESPGIAKGKRLKRLQV